MILYDKTRQFPLFTYLKLSVKINLIIKNNFNDKINFLGGR